METTKMLGDALNVMLYGIGGAFFVMLILYGACKGLVALFPNKENVDD